LRKTALCRRTRQIIAFVNGDRSEKSCRKLWQKIPESYRTCLSFSDFWQAYAKVFSEQTHQCVGKDSGQTNHMERWNNTLQQRLGRLTRKTLSFSKDEAWHENVIHWFIICLYHLKVSHYPFTALNLIIGIASVFILIVKL
jgi:insertion element IS1 protein InsB